MKILVVFYSSSGTTRRVGQAFATQLGADVEDIQEVKPRHLDVTEPGGIGKLVKIMLAGAEANLGLSVPILPATHNAADYDLILLGTPLWGSSLPGPVRSYIVKHREQFKAVAFFATCQGPNPNARCFAQMEKACGKAPVATATYQANQVLTGDLAELVAGLVNQICRSA